jgi:hypothetical protein
MPGSFKTAAVAAALGLLFLARGGTATSAAAAAPVVAEARDVHGFDEVELHGVGTLVITQGEAEALTITAEADVLPKLATEVRDGRLTIRPTASFEAQEPITYALTVRELSAVTVDGAARVEAAHLRAGAFALTVGGSGGAALAGLTADALTVTASGGAELELAGTVDHQTVALDGASVYRAEELTSREATVTAAGAAQATVQVSEALTARADGAGRVAYLGAPRVRQEVAGAGTVAQLG